VAGKQERQRKLARERYERRLARQAERQQRTRTAAKVGSVGLVLLVIAAAVAIAVLHLNSSSKANALASRSAAPSTVASTPAASPSPSVTEPARNCAYLPTPGQPAARKVGTPPTTPAYKAAYQATITTNRGPIVIDLLNSKATCTVNSFVYLATKKYFNGTHCHRLTTAAIYVLQCGDPTGTGTGGPGYEFADENLTGATYPAGTVAMAHSSLPHSNGSQFFLVYKDTSLPPSYTPFGTIVSGLKVLLGVAKAGSDNANGQGDGHPKEKVVIESITIKKT
jgi:peptidyl-prolyl cis-trans isomerase B (cyclophilin B)